MAEERLYSNSWYRVEDLRPKLRNHTEFHRHHYRGQLTYVLQDHANERYHRFSPISYELIGLMDGVRTSDEIWQMASERMQDEAPTQDQFIQLLGQLHSADILLTDVPPDTAEVLQRYDKQRRKKWMQQLMSPLFWRFPVYDPEKLLNRLKPLVEPFYSRLALIIWSVVVATGLVLAVVNWGSLSENVVDRVLSTQNIFLLWFIFPVFKGLHEFGHAFTVKRYGGEVHVMGIMLLVLTPLPFVDASAASAFRSKRQRILVSSAGMMVEIFLASLALMLWLNIEPGLIRTILFNVIFIAGVSTILFNINPLLRFDGYYILADLIEIVNLRSRSTRYLSHVLEKNLLGNKEAVPMPATPGERRWFIFYSIASFIYRIFILTAIIMFIASKFFFVGVALAIWAVIAWGILPIYKVVKYIVSSPRLYKVRARAVGASGGVLLAALLLMFVIPMPMHTRADGVIWVPEQAIIRAGADGFIVEILAPPGSSVRKGDPLLRIHDEMAELDLKVHAEELAEIAIQAAEKARQMGHEPRVAMVSHSTFGNPYSEDTDRIREAVGILENSNVDFEYDGDMAVDVALDTELLKLYPFCRLSGPANVLVMPALHAATTASKLLDKLGGGTVVGPVMIGMEKPAQIAQMGATVNDLVNLAALAAHEAEHG